jgi:hypothetical protein
MRSIMPKGAHPGLQSDHPGSIDALEVAHAAHLQLQRGSAPGHEQAVDDVAALLLANGDGRQADFRSELQQVLEGGGVGAGMAHDLADVRVPHPDGEVHAEASLEKDSLMDMDSGTDSLIRSASRTAAARSVVYVRRPKVSSICSCVAPRCSMKCAAYSRDRLVWSRR